MEVPVSATSDSSFAQLDSGKHNSSLNVGRSCFFCCCQAQAQLRPGRPARPDESAARRPHDKRRDDDEEEEEG